ncbi:MAG: four helix bundle protein [Candidatus Taylorbacteria bacterium CG11_big_fil_rev_8_21_14_0_20_46_11]|uniref:Four helix bundle protein n=1 Tax=Candidatus Taylorbacteria bacterium CG11_big_fil_rev_8_21_14_0_20_46_11 TaxID=1975025 RepID=A0A2H0KB97_9BACT|nr:MAG: four helix bundle protein [Candidatus Taylorbacteria bacterium CG11_big_fil_rev_8_21_14_0_20_46_11]
MDAQKTANSEKYHERLHRVMDEYVHLVYDVSRSFPKEEQYGATSQLRRASLSIILNYVEGYARQRTAVHKNFLEISYGSLKESSYLTTFACSEKWLLKNDLAHLQVLEGEIGAMLWGILRNM